MVCAERVETFCAGNLEGEGSDHDQGNPFMPPPICLPEPGPVVNEQRKANEDRMRSNAIRFILGFEKNFVPVDSRPDWQCCSP